MHYTVKDLISNRKIRQVVTRDNLDADPMNDLFAIAFSISINRCGSLFALFLFYLFLTQVNLY
jgi:hypothetical protein